MITGSEAEYLSDARSKKDTPYLALAGELWGDFCEYLWENWPRYTGTALYLHDEAVGVRDLSTMLLWADYTFEQETWALTHWGRVTQICVSNLIIIGSDNGLSPCRRQAIIWTNAVILLVRPLGTNFNDIVIEIHTFSFKKMNLKLSSGRWPPFCLGLNVLMKVASVVDLIVHWSVLAIEGTQPWTNTVHPTLYGQK